jgi:RadC-like JAB domain
LDRGCACDEPLENDRFREYLTVWHRTGKKEDSSSQLEEAIDKPELVYNLFAQELRLADREILAVALLDTRFRLIKKEQISVGILNEGSHAGKVTGLPTSNSFRVPGFDLFSSRDIFRWRRAFLPRRLRLLRSEPPW